MTATTWELWREPGVKYYLGVSAAGLGLVFLLLNHSGVTMLGTYLPLLIGAIGAGTGWSRAPLVYLITLAVVISVEPNRSLLSAHGGGSAWLVDVLLCIGTLGFLAAQYRLQALLKGVFPMPAMENAGNPAMQHTARNEPGLQRRVSSVTPREVGSLLLLLPAWAVVAEFLAALLPASFGNPGLRPAVWRGMTLLWLLAFLALILSSVLDYYYRRHMSADEATLYLQDVLWRDTRREQHRIQRWRAWGRLGFPRLPFGRTVEVLGLFAEIATYIILPTTLVMIAAIIVTWLLSILRIIP